MNVWVSFQDEGCARDLVVKVVPVRWMPEMVVKVVPVSLMDDHNIVSVSQGLIFSSRNSSNTRSSFTAVWKM
ncbi:unnamed protein product [Rhodiola kirilowii]